MGRNNNDSLSEYFGINNVRVENGCIIRVPEDLSRDIQEAFRTYPFLTDEYIYLEESNILIDKVLASKIKKKTTIGKLTPDEINLLIDDGILSNPNIYLCMRLVDQITRTELSNFPRIKRELGKYFDRIVGIDTICSDRGIETDFVQEKWEMQDIIDYFSKSFSVYQKDMDYKVWNELIKNLRNDKEKFQKKIF